MYAGLTTVQLHGGVDTLLSSRLAKLVPEVRVIQTVPWGLDDEEAEMHVGATLAALEPNRRVLLDAKVANVSGGLGVALDWQAAGARGGAASWGCA